MRGAASLRSLSILPRLFLAGVLGAVATVADAAPANDAFANAAVLTGLTNFVVSQNGDATAEAGEPSHANSAPGKSVWWSWQAPFTGSVGVSTRNSTFDTLLAVYTGDSVANLQPVADNDDDPAGGFGIVTSTTVFRAIAGETYRIAVDGFNGATGVVRLAVGRVGYPAPSWTLEDLQGNEVSSTNFQNQVLVIDFWETICGACVDELPYLKRIYWNYSSEGFTIFGISKDDKTANVRQWVEDEGIPYDIAMNNLPFEGLFGGNVALPTKFVIDREGNIVTVYVGGGDYALYEKIIKPLVRGAREVPLRIRRQGSGFVFAWPATEFGYNLESSSTLASGSWTAVPSSPTITNEQNTVTVAASAGAKFFRLRKTPPTGH